MSEQGYLLFTAHIQEAYKHLSGTERKLADYMLKNPQAILTATARSLAEELNVSTATVVRFCRSCGFSGLTDLKLSLQREYAALCLDGGQAVLGKLKRDDSVSVVKQKVLGYHNMIINIMLSNWNETAYEDAVEAILKANRIIILGEGGSRCSAMCLFSILTNLGLNCESYMDSVFEIMKVSSLREGDVVIGITFTGRLRNTLESMQLAKQRGAVTIGMVGYLESPIIPYVDILLNTTNLKKDYYDSALGTRISEIAVIEVLTTLLSIRLDRPIKEPTAVAIRRVDGHNS